MLHIAGVIASGGWSTGKSDNGGSLLHAHDATPLCAPLRGRGCTRVLRAYVGSGGAVSTRFSVPLLRTHGGVTVHDSRSIMKARFSLTAFAAPSPCVCPAQHGAQQVNTTCARAQCLIVVCSLPQSSRPRQPDGDCLTILRQRRSSTTFMTDLERTLAELHTPTYSMTNNSCCTCSTRTVVPPKRASLQQPCPCF